MLCFLVLASGNHEGNVRKDPAVLAMKKRKREDEEENVKGEK
jgi:hypothetical protein